MVTSADSGTGVDRAVGVAFERTVPGLAMSMWPRVGVLGSTKSPESDAAADDTGAGLLELRNAPAASATLPISLAGELWRVAVSTITSSWATGTTRASGDATSDADELMATLSG